MLSEPLNLNRLAYFSAVADAGSFTKAAARLGISKAVVSSQVAQLERDLKITLLARTTRRMHLTESGKIFHGRCTEILRAAGDAFAELAATEAAPTGTLRIAAPNDYGIAVIVPIANAFRQKFPACSVDLMLGDQTVDLVQNQIDLAVRVGWLADSSLQSRKIGSFNQCLVGDSRMISVIAGVTTPNDLTALPFIANRALRKPLLWKFEKDGQAETEVDMQSSMAVDTTLGVLAAVRAGCGLSVLPEFLVAPDLASGKMLQVLPDWRLPVGGIFTVFPAARFRSTKVTAFIEMLVAAEHKRTTERAALLARV